MPKINNKPQLKKALIEALKKSLGIVSEAVDIVGVNRTTYYKWLKEDQEFKTQVEQIDEYAIDFVESQLYKNIKEGKEASILFYLKTKAKKRGYIERTEIGMENIGDKTFKITIIEGNKDNTELPSPKG